ncbi:putative mfs transporter protein [Neofusicoccum parvum UCRNP2]|uniref:Putative mfs transporter protein n=1 Tax=Botryosphaeria parva (strain UCR-NP2) TaxID=1287680 RepID=R1E650_BOTPV|nr:putative mfs transporter protein [Neofusicoccum parvum UCRNP2]
MMNMDKHGVEVQDIKPVNALSKDDEIAQLTPEEYLVAEKRLVRKIDLRIMPCLFLVIVLNYLDRNALANARVQGIEESLGLKGSQFNTAISVLFAGYLALQIPSNLILTRVRPSLYLPGLDTFGYGKIETLLLVAPPYVFSTIVALSVSYSSDKFTSRSWHIFVPMSVGLAGYVVAASTLALAARYLALFLMLAGVHGSYNIALAWISSTLPRPIEKRSAAIAIINTVGNVAQIYSPYLYLSEDAPRYIKAMATDSCFCLLCICGTLTLRLCLQRANRKMAQREAGTAVGPRDGAFVL